MKINVNIAKHPKKEIIISTDFIRLDSFLKFQALVETGGQAKEDIQKGIIKVNGEICTARGKKLRDGDTVSAYGVDYIIKNET